MAKNVHSLLVRGVLVVLVVGLGFWLLSPPGRAIESSSSIQATLCDSQPPDVMVSSPLSDSVTNQAQIQVVGIAQRTTHLDSFVNGVYNGSIAISYQNPAFSTPVQLAVGTNTIELDANFSCNGTTQHIEIIVTYQPDSKPSNGGDTPTKPSSGDGVAGGSASRSQAGQPDWLEPVITNLTITMSEGHGLWPDFVRPLTNWLALLALLLGLALAVLPRCYLLALVALVGIKRPLRAAELLILRAVALTLALVFAIIVQV